MRLKYLPVALLLVTTGCGNSDKTPKESSSTETSNQENTKANTNWEKLVWNAYRDQTGAVMAEMPFPASWKIAERPGKGEPSISGPNGIKITDYPAQSFMYSNNPSMQQIYYQSGQKLRAMPGVEQVIQEDLVPWAANKGLEFVRSYEVPEVTAIDKWYNDQLYKAMPTQTEIKAIGTDWKTADGKPYFLLLHLCVSTGADLQTWYYIPTSLEADTEHFEKAKKQLLFSLANTHYPLEPIMAYNQREAEKAGQSWAAFNQRMAQNQANFEASQRAHVNKSNAINDAIMNGWRERNAASDKAHEQFVDVITERTNTVDPSTGQKYKVQSGYNQYWMNSNGEYISTNQNDYNPNLDENMNNKKWQELKEVK